MGMLKASILGIIAVFVAIVILGALATGYDNASEALTPKYTLAQFSAIPMGATYKDVVALLGDEGTQTNAQQVFNMTMVTCVWRNYTGSYISVGFTNGYVSSKYQSGL